MKTLSICVHFALLSLCLQYLTNHHFLCLTVPYSCSFIHFSISQFPPTSISSVVNSPTMNYCLDARTDWLLSGRQVSGPSNWHIGLWKVKLRPCGGLLEIMQLSETAGMPSGHGSGFVKQLFFWRFGNSCASLWQFAGQEVKENLYRLSFSGVLTLLVVCQRRVDALNVWKTLLNRLRRCYGSKSQNVVSEN